MKTKTNTKIKIALVIIIGIALLWAYSAHKDHQMDEYAKAHNCTWTIQGSHDICK